MDALRLDDLIAIVRSRSSGDPLEQLHEAASLKSEVEELTDALLGHFVDQARRSGATWSQIGEALGVTKQAAQQKHTSTESTARRILSVLAPKLASGGFRRFTPRAKSVVVAAQEAAVGFGASEIGTDHVLLGLYAEPDGVAVLVLDELGLDREAVTAAVLERAPADAEPVRGHVPFSTGSKQALENALRSAVDLGHNYIGTEHILLGILRLDAGEPGAELLAESGITESAARERIVQHLVRR
jgi:Clp amino terminal domain, pathogenicity island component